MLLRGNNENWIQMLFAHFFAGLTFLTLYIDNYDNY